MILTLTINHNKCIWMYNHSFFFPSVSRRPSPPPFTLNLFSRSLPLSFILSLVTPNTPSLLVSSHQNLHLQISPSPFFNSLQLFSSITLFINLNFQKIPLKQADMLFYELTSSESPREHSKNTDILGEANSVSPAWYRIYICKVPR